MFYYSFKGIVHPKKLMGKSLVFFLRKSMGLINYLVIHMHQNIFFCIQQLHTDLKQLESEQMMTDLLFLGKLSL